MHKRPGKPIRIVNFVYKYVNMVCLHQVAEKRVRRWGFSCWDLLRDPVGHDHFKAFLEKEYATENLFFVEAVWRMKKLPQKVNV